MTRRIKVTYFISLMLILLALMTFIYQVVSPKADYNNEKMYPNFTDYQNKINQIDIRYPDTKMTIIRKDNVWRIKTSDRYFAEQSMIEKLYQDIQSISLIADKTQNIQNFSHINLLNPTITEEIKGEGTRITLSINGKKPLCDFIVGVPLASYKNFTNRRLFMRYANNRGALLTQANSLFNHKPHDFFIKDYGMPKLQEIVKMNLMYRDKKLLSLHRVIDTNDTNKITFLPPTIPTNKQLLYPEIFDEYMVALTEKLRPIEAIKLPSEKMVPDTSIVFQLTKERIVKINFWNSDKNNYYMRFIRDDLKDKHHYYIFVISKQDYETFIQPLAHFLKDDDFDL